MTLATVSVIVDLMSDLDTASARLFGFTWTWSFSNGDAEVIDDATELAECATLDLAVSWTSAAVVTVDFPLASSFTRSQILWT